MNELILISFGSFLILLMLLFYINFKHTRRILSEHHGLLKEIERGRDRFETILSNELRINREEFHTNSREDRRELNTSLKTLEESIGIELERMRIIVEEKLHTTLDSRLSSSFRLVSDRLEQVQKGLGEMHSLAQGIGDLKMILSNVKTKGILGEYQLESILENLFPRSQYEKNIITKRSSNFRVEFAIKIPSKDENESIIWLPVDAKLPTQDYISLCDSYEDADPIGIAEAKKNIEQRIKKSAKDISEKYIDPPNTTDFAIMFLPFEGLYSEVLRISGLFEYLQRQYRVIITGPTTIAAFLNSLQIGFRTLAMEKRSGEIWQLLSRVKTDFVSFGDILENTQKKLNEINNVIINANRKSRAIEKKLQDVQELPY